MHKYNSFIKDFLYSVFVHDLFIAKVKIIRIIKTWFVSLLKPCKITKEDLLDDKTGFVSDITLTKAVFTLTAILIINFFLKGVVNSEISQTDNIDSIFNLAFEFIVLLIFVINLALFIGIGRLLSINFRDKENEIRIWDSYYAYEYCVLFFVAYIISLYSMKICFAMSFIHLIYFHEKVKMKNNVTKNISFRIYYLVLSFTFVCFNSAVTFFIKSL